MSAAVPEQTVSPRVPPVRRGAGGVAIMATTRPGSGRGARMRRLVVAGRWWWSAIGMLVLGWLVVTWAGTRPGYDPYGWLVWGHLTVHGALNTDGAPSWKPLPYLFTVPYALTGARELILWEATSVGVSLAGVAFAWRVAFALSDAPPARRYAAYLAGAVAGAAILAIEQYPHSILSSQSDAMIVTLCLAAVDCTLHRRYRWAFWLWWLASLGRPEAWVPAVGFVAWAWWRRPGMRVQIVAGAVALVALWFGIPALTSRSPFSAATLAQHSPRAPRGNRIAETLSRFSALDAGALKLAAALAVLRGLSRRDRAVGLFALGTLAWVAVEVVLAVRGYPAVPRYMYEPAAGVCVLAGVFCGRVVLDAPVALAWLSRRAGARSARLGRFLRSPGFGGATVALMLLVLAWGLHGAVRGRYDSDRADLRAQRLRTHDIAVLGSLVRRLGPARIRACGVRGGVIDIPVEYQSLLAYVLGTNTGVLYYNPGAEAAHPRPVLTFQPLPGGWRVLPGHLETAAARADCARLRAGA